MQLMMQVVEDTQVEGRRFPRGCRVQLIQAGDSCLLLPDPDAYTTPCAVPAKNLARLTLFRVMLVKHQVGLIKQQERWGRSADDIRSSFAQCTPGGDSLALEEALS